MADQINKDSKEIPVPEKKMPVQEELANFSEKEKVVENKEKIEDENLVSQEIKRELELMNLDDNLKKEAEQKANKIQFLADDDKLKKLLEFAREKGVVYAIKMAKAMNDPFILDTLHDALAKGGYYEKFIKK